MKNILRRLRSVALRWWRVRNDLCIDCGARVHVVVGTDDFTLGENVPLPGATEGPDGCRCAYHSDLHTTASAFSRRMAQQVDAELLDAYLGKPGALERLPEPVREDVRRLRERVQ